MNVILHQWLKSKKACALVFISLIAKGVEAVVEAEWMVLIPAILSSGNVKPYITTFVLVSIFGVLSSAVREIAMKHSPCGCTTRESSMTTPSTSCKWTIGSSRSTPIAN